MVIQSETQNEDDSFLVEQLLLVEVIDFKLLFKALLDTKMIMAVCFYENLKPWQILQLRRKS